MMCYVNMLTIGVEAVTWKSMSKYICIDISLYIYVNNASKLSFAFA